MTYDGAIESINRFNFNQRIDRCSSVNHDSIDRSIGRRGPVDRVIDRLINRSMSEPMMILLHQAASTLSIRYHPASACPIC